MEDDVLKLPSFTPTQQAVTELQRYERDDIIVTDAWERESTIYAMFEDVCEQNGDVLVKVKIYESGEALRANLYLTGKKDTILRNYRASDAVALAIFYGIPILVKNTLLKEKLKV